MNKKIEKKFAQWGRNIEVKKGDEDLRRFSYHETREDFIDHLELRRLEGRGVEAAQILVKVFCNAPKKGEEPDPDEYYVRGTEMFFKKGKKWKRYNNRGELEDIKGRWGLYYYAGEELRIIENPECKTYYYTWI